MISECFFLNIDITASVIDVNGGSLEVESTHFRRITRTEGKGSAAIDALNPQSLEISASFCHCHSLEGVAGALNIVNSEDAYYGYLDVLLIGNKGKDDQTAHDILVSGVTQEDLTIVLSSSSEQPQIISDIDIEISSRRITSLMIVEDDVVADLMTTDIFVLSVEMCSHILPIPCSKQLSRHRHLGVRGSAILEVHSVLILLNTQHTAPVITVDAQSSFVLEKSVVSSDGGMSQRPFARSEGRLTFTEVMFVDMSFDGCSCIETTGGTMAFDGSHNSGSAGICSLSTNVDGAFLNAVNTNISLSDSVSVDCHARNGGAVFTKDCLSVHFGGFFIDCSAKERGGGFCSEHSGSISPQADFGSASPFVNCQAKLGGGFFLTLAPMMNFLLHSNQPELFHGQDISYPLFESCSAEKGAGAYLDGESGLSTQHLISSYNSLNDVLCLGSEFYISKSLAESIIENGRLVSEYFQSGGSLSSRSESDDGPYKHVEVEGYPQHSFNFKFPNIVVHDHNSIDLTGCLGEYFTLYCNSLRHIVDRFHTQTDNGRFLQVPIKLKDTMFLFETARVMKQSIKLILDDYEWLPRPERTKIVFGDDHNSEITVFIVVDTSGSVELSELKVDWDEDLTLCHLVDRTASMSILGSEIKIASALSFPLIACEAGTLVISTSSFLSTTSDIFGHPLVLCGMSTSFALNSAQSEMIVEMIVPPQTRQKYTNPFLFAKTQNSNYSFEIFAY
ncbi:hypothetical protein BLNAU_19986 [Blattamonas nauphoetae]|uniref:Uncharacterized protein n=1 Tax=Blattamonas nauphoetae TaxID=2049346 RepID=A0ABQ9X0I6_9EUKA|nr:hypothetical protein BLNAU_19986 [Blattamonas nauphoetae]